MRKKNQGVVKIFMRHTNKRNSFGYRETLESRSANHDFFQGNNHIKSKTDLITLGIVLSIGYYMGNNRRGPEF